MPEALVRPYCSLVDVQKECRNSKTENNDLFTLCINRASRWIDDFCKRDFWFHDHTSGYDVPRDVVLGDVVVLPWPVITLTYLAVWEKYTEDPAADDEFDSDEFYYRVGKATIESEAGNFGPHPFKLNMRVKGTFGYALADTDPDTTPPPSLPSAIRRACCLVASAWSMEKRVQQVGLDGATTELLDTTVPKEVRTLLEKHVFRAINNF